VTRPQPAPADIRALRLTVEAIRAVVYGLPDPPDPGPDDILTARRASIGIHKITFRCLARAGVDTEQLLTALGLVVAGLREEAQP
jgi:hypothetical protein